MERFELTCIGCPLGCLMTVEKNGDEIKVKGNTCLNGERYAKEEVTAPKRILTQSVRVRDGVDKMCSVKTSAPIPKDMIIKASETIREKTVDAPIEIGKIIISNICDTGVDIIATREVRKKA